MPTAAANDLQIDYITAGPDGGPAVLLVCGLGQQRLWPIQLVQPLADAGVRVIAYDNRDIGASTWLDDEPAIGPMNLLTSAARGALPVPPYTLADMADDGMAVLDALGVNAAHVVGVSMGGMISQRMAIRHPERVISLTSIMSTTGDPSVPPPTPAAGTALLTPIPLDDREGYIAAAMARWDVLGSPGMPRDLDGIRSAVALAFDRGINPPGFMRQYHAILADGDRTAELAALDVPTLVIHGAQDPLVRPEGGKATAAAVPGADLHLIEGMGHDLPPAACERIVALLLDRINPRT